MKTMIFTVATDEQISAEYKKKLSKLRSHKIITVSALLYKNRDKAMPIMEICLATDLTRKKVIEIIGELKRRHGFIVRNSNYKNPNYQLVGFANKVKKSVRVLEIVKPKLNSLIEKVFS